MTTIYKNVDVEVDLDLDDVREFISEAGKSTLEEIAKALAEHDVHASLTALHAPTIRYLINRAETFGLNEMLDELKREGERVGAYLRVEVKA